MVWLYILAAALIAWGIVKDLNREETWMIGFGRITKREQPKSYWLTVTLRGFILLAVLIAAYLRSRAS